MIRLIMMFVVFFWGNSLPAQTAPNAPKPARWMMNFSGGYQWASKPHYLGRFTDALISPVSTSGTYAFDMSFFWQAHLGIFAAARFSRTPRDWPGAFMQAMERAYPGKIVHLTDYYTFWDASVSHAQIGLRGRYFFRQYSLLPSLGIGLLEGPISDGAADIKTPGSNALSNVFAYTPEIGPYYSSLALDAGCRLEIPFWWRFRCTFSAQYTWVKPNETFEVHTFDQISGARLDERLHYSRPQHVFALTAGLSYHFKRRGRWK